MNDIEFRAWPKTPRLFRDMIITEKIDGTNSAVGVVDLGTDLDYERNVPEGVFHIVERQDIGQVPAVHYYGVYAQSRNRLIRPGKGNDNYGFAQWATDNAATLVADLGPGLHFGEWWGNGIQRGYGLPKDDKRFSLFNVSRYGNRLLDTPGLATVPIVRQYTFSTDVARHALAEMVDTGSFAAPGYMFPEGIVVYHTAANSTFKMTVENDESPKSLVE